MIMMIKKYLNLFFVLALFFYPFKVKAQSTDFRARLSASIEHELLDNLNGSLEIETRFDKFLSTYDRSFIEGAVSYDVVKYLRIGVSGRFMHDMNDVRVKSTAYRSSLFVRVKTSFDDFDIKIKSTLQYGFDELSQSAYSFSNKLINRNSIGVDYNWFGTKFKPFIEYEFFYHINNVNGGIINQSRIKSGTSFSFNKSSEISLYYMFENEFNVIKPTDSHIIGFSYNYKF